MTYKIYIDSSNLEKLLGPAYLRELTFPQIFKDSRYSVSPLVVVGPEGSHLIVGAADAAAHQAVKQPVPFSTYGRYFDWSQGKGYKQRSLIDALSGVVGTASVKVEGCMPVGRYRDIATAFAASVFDARPTQAMAVYRKSKGELEAGWRATRDADVPRLVPFVSRLRFGQRLVEAMSAEPIGFSVLDRLVSEAGLDAILVSAPFDLEMFTGLPAAQIEDLGLFALYIPGEADIVVFSPSSLQRADFRPDGSTDSLAQAIGRFAGGAVGFCKDHLAIDVFEPLAAAGLDLKDATYALRRWFDERAGTDLLYFITAANAVLAGVDYASSFIRRAAAGDVLTERDVAALYHQGVEMFAHSIGMDGRIRPYFDIIHPGERTLLPATAGDYPISLSHKTIKFDMGLLVTDATGVVRGCSDIARTISTDPALQAAHDKLRALLVDELIPAIRPGMSGGEIHARGVEILRPITEELKSCGLLHADMDMDGYTRDCGHTLQRQTLATVHFLPGFGERLHAGMLGCTEFVWPIDDLIVACEDGYYVTEEGAIPFTV